MNPATIGLVSGAVQLLWVAIALAVGVLLVLAYSQQKIAGYLWLLMAVVVWPVITRIAMFGFTMALPQIAARNAYPYQTIAMMQVVVGGLFQLVDAVLLVIAVVKLTGEVRRLLEAAPMEPVRSAPYVPPPPPPAGSQWPAV